MFRFANSEFLFLLFIVPIVVVVFILLNYRKKSAVKRFGNPELLAQLMPEVSKLRPVVKLVFLLLTIVFIIMAIARPQFGSKLQEVKREGIELVIALDVSNSMLAEDLQPNRLERAKQAISKLIDKLENDKLGLVVFAGDAYIQLPITTDYAAAKMFLSTINTEIVPKQGTAIGAAIDLASRCFTPETKAGKAIIVITDGENHEDDAVGAAKRAAEKGITVHAIGMGMPRGVPIPIRGTYGQINYRKDSEGKTVLSKLNENLLQQLVAAGGGTYIRATNSKIGLNEIFDEIGKMNKEEYEAKVYADYEEQFQYFVGLALFFIILEYFILERKNKWLSNLKLFKV
ncbi:MAG: VWA domain-containing protein [Bacteroidales bacterium]|nr:VWA domain-containing protein [Bacteroidales bacterium]